MKFGMVIPQGWRLDLAGIDPLMHWGVMAGLARRADSSDDWSSVWVHDHLHSMPASSEEATHEAWTLMSALAAVTGRVRLGQIGTCLAYRSPAHLAKVAATVDVISEGRLEVGVEAGWYEQECRAYGFDLPSPADRMGALREGVDILRQAWTTGKADLDGKHHQVQGAVCRPRPLQGTAIEGSARNGIPLWVAGNTAESIRFAAEVADGICLDGTPEYFRQQNDLLVTACQEAGRDESDLLRSAQYDVVIGRDEAEVRARLEWYRDHHIQAGTSEEQALADTEKLMRQPLVGTVEQVEEVLHGLKAQGLSYAICYFAEAAYDVSGIELFEHSVIPALQDATDHAGTDEPRHHGLFHHR